MSADGLRPPPNTKEGWAAFMSEGLRQPTELLTAADLERLDPDGRMAYDDARVDHHSEVHVVNTPDFAKITKTGRKLITTNRSKQLGRHGLIVSGLSGTGKSTSIMQLGKVHQAAIERRASGSTGRIPVVYIIVPPAATPKMLAIEIANFLGLRFRDSDSQNTITHSVTAMLGKVGCGLILVDEIHRLDLRTKAGATASDQLKYLFDSVSATFVYAGIDLAENGMFSGTRGRQIAGRFITLNTSAFGYATDSQRTGWARLVTDMEESLRLYRHKPGALVALAPYLHERTHGMIGSLDQLIHEAANDAIADGTERITKKHLAAVVLDTAAEEQYVPPAPRRRSTAAGRKSSR